MDKKKFLILGDSGFGKDEFAMKLANETPLTYCSSSWRAAEIFIFDYFNNQKDLPSYPDVISCYLDRVNHRHIWHDLISEYNKEIPHRLAADIYREYDIYVGMRNPVELESTRKVFDPYIIFVDAYKRVGKTESSASNKIPREQGMDIANLIINNNAGLHELQSEVLRTKRLLGY